MEDLTANTQPEQYLDLLLEHLACPVDNSILLTAIRNPAGKVVALKSKDRGYQVVNNVPCMIPDLGESKSGGLTLWQELQGKLRQKSESSPEDVFSAQDNRTAHYVGQIIGRTGDGLFLDVGCGALDLPPYMAKSSGSVAWIGIDPIFGDITRQFPFAQALGEYLPFRPQVFDGVLYASVFRNLIDPLRSLQRTRSILKPQGRVYVWYTISRVDSRYIVWKIKRTLGLARRYDELYQWAYTHKSVQALLKRAGFAIEQVVPLCETCPDYLTCRMPTEFLAVAGYT